MNVQNLAFKIVQEILDDLSGRRGIGDEWQEISEPIQKNIRGDLEAIVENRLRKYQEEKKEEKNPEKVNHPEHYNQKVPGIECIDVVENFGFNLGNVIKYIWREEDKDSLIDLKKAMWYLEREINNREDEENARLARTNTIGSSGSPENASERPFEDFPNT